MELPRATKAGASENPGFLRAGGVRHEFILRIRILFAPVSQRSLDRLQLTHRPKNTSRQRLRAPSILFEI
jgi:hypothetical protein